ncbi:MAG: methyltransferase domain-containing protein [Actinomycetota bacterium]|nr:methyltransferase domain-containing protein [Actinomycetota bacterium]
MTAYEGDKFGGATSSWIGRLGNLRNVVRQELIRRQLASHLPGAPAHVIDVGAGQGTQAVALAALGHEVLALEPSEEMRDACATTLAELDAATAARVTINDGRIDTLVAPDTRRTSGDEAAAPTRFDVVCCHGVLMYLDDPAPALAALAGAVAPGGILSLVARNAGGMALRPGLRGDWRGVIDLLAAAATDRRYRNEIGVEARADDIDETVAALAEHGLAAAAVYGVRLVTDGVDVDTPVPADRDELAALLDAEDALCRTDPYRRVATLFHVIARRPQ